MEAMLFLLIGVSVISGGGVAYYLKNKYADKQMLVKDVKAYTSFV